MNKIITDQKFQENFAVLAGNTTNTLASNGDKSGFDLLNTAWGLPGNIFHRDLAGDTRIVQLNSQLVVLLGAFVGVAMVAAAASNVISIRKGGQGGNLAGGIIAMMSIVVATVVAAPSIDILALPQDAANLIFDTIGSATIKDFANPGLQIAPTPFPFGGIILAAMYIVIFAFLTFVYYKELAWCGVLLASSGLWLFSWLLPWSVPRSIGSGLGMKFIGTLFSPAIALIALRLAAPTMADFQGGLDASQMMRMLYAAVAYEAPAVIAGAIAVHVPAFGDAWATGHATRFLRPGVRGSSGSGGHGSGPEMAGHSGAATAPRPTSSGHMGSATAKSVFRGGRA